MSYIRALIIRIGFGGILYYNYNKEGFPLKVVSVVIEAPILNPKPYRSLKGTLKAPLKELFHCSFLPTISECLHRRRQKLPGSTRSQPKRSSENLGFLGVRGFGGLEVLGGLGVLGFRVLGGARQPSRDFGKGSAFSSVLLCRGFGSRTCGLGFRGSFWAEDLVQELAV